MLLTLKTWELLTIQMINQTVDEAMVLLSKSRNAKDDDDNDDNAFPLDGAHIKRLVRDFLPPCPELDVLEGYAHAQLIGYEWPAVGDTIEVLVESCSFYATPRETLWFILEQKEYDRHNPDALNPYWESNTLFACTFMEITEEPIKPWRRYEKEIEYRISVQVLQSIPFRHLDQYFPPLPYSPTWRNLISPSSYKVCWENPYRDWFGDERPVEIQGRALGVKNYESYSGQEFRFIQSGSSWYCFLAFSYNSVHAKYRFRCHWSQVPSEDVKLLGLERPTQWETTNEMQRLANEYSGTDDWESKFEHFLL